jgi:hypothetical protein
VVDLRDSSGLATNTYRANRVKSIEPPTLANPRR